VAHCQSRSAAHDSSTGLGAEGACTRVSWTTRTYLPQITPRVLLLRTFRVLHSSQYPTFCAPSGGRHSGSTPRTGAHSSGGFSHITCNARGTATRDGYPLANFRHARGGAGGGANGRMATPPPRTNLPKAMVHGATAPARWPLLADNSSSIGFTHGD
jgi:hypothetical protein